MLGSQKNDKSGDFIILRRSKRSTVNILIDLL